MAPEAGGDLVVLDLQMIGSNVECEVDRLDVETADEDLHISWNATECPPGADPIGNGTVFVWRPQGYIRRRYHSKPDILDDGYSWVHPVQRTGLMLVIVFPPGYRLPDVNDATPTFARCKELEGRDRMALYWKLGGGPRAQVSWKMKPFSDQRLEEHIASLNNEASRRVTLWSGGAIIDVPPLEQPSPPPTTFVIHGHDDIGVGQLKDCLRRLGLPEPVVMKERLVSGASLPEKFEQLAHEAGFALALLTPDDLGGPAGGQEIFSRARQNAWLEIGWFWGRLGRDHLMLLVKGEDVEFPSDLKGLEYYSYKKSPEDVSEEIRRFYEAHKVPIH